MADPAAAGLAAPALHVPRPGPRSPARSRAAPTRRRWSRWPMPPGCDVTADPRRSPAAARSASEADRAASLADSIGVDFRCVTVDVRAGPNVEARARDVRLAALPPGTLTGHTADDQAETMLINLLRGAGLDGLAAMGPAPTRPLLALRRGRDARAVRRHGSVRGRRPEQPRPPLRAQPRPRRAPAVARRHRRA